MLLVKCEINEDLDLTLFILKKCSPELMHLLFKYYSPLNYDPF